MKKPKIELKKIDNIAARQVTFNKRRRGLFKKAQELSTLCDAEISITVFSDNDKLFEHPNNSRVQQLLEKYDLHTSICRLQQPPEEMQLERDTYNMMCKELADKTLELRRFNGEELQGLKIQELQKLEKLIGRGLSRVSKAKDESLRKAISDLKKKGVELAEDNQRLKQTQSLANDQGQSSKSTMIPSGPSNIAHQDSDSYDASLNLGLAMFK